MADEEGRQVALTFTIEQELLERFAEADRAIVGSLQLVKPADPKANRSIAAGDDSRRR